MIRENRRKPPLDRFYSHVKKTDGCWLWTGGTNGKYGVFGGLPGALGHGYAHRWAWIFANGEIPKGMHICHHCDTPLCVRPDHLFMGTASDNHRDKVSKGRHHRQLHPMELAGEKNPACKLTDEQVRELRKFWRDTGLSFPKIAKRFGISRSQALFICKFKQRVAAGV